MKAVDSLPPEIPYGYRSVYVITLMNTGKSYVGSSMNVRARVHQHLRNLLSGCHQSKDMQSDFDNCCNGLKVGVYEEIENPRDLRLFEDYIIDELDSVANGYNTKRAVGDRAILDREYIIVFPQHRDTRFGIFLEAFPRMGALNPKECATFYVICGMMSKENISSREMASEVLVSAMKLTEENKLRNILGSLMMKGFISWHTKSSLRVNKDIAFKF